MKSAKSDLFLLTVSCLLCLALSASPGAAQLEMDGDLPAGVVFGIEHTVDGNPLDGGDFIYTLRGTYRFFSGYLGLEAGIGYSEPTSDFVRSLGPEAELLLFDFSLVWYVGYPERKWPPSSRIKSEFVVFGGPGWASLRIDDAFPSFPLSDASKDYFTINFGAGVNLHGRTGEEYTTTPWYIRPEVKARWFPDDGDGEIDWGIGVTFGYGFGKRLSRGALELSVETRCRQTGEFLTEVNEDYGSEFGTSAEERDRRHQKAMYYRDALQDLKAQTATCGSACDDFEKCIDDQVGDLNGYLKGLLTEVEDPR